MADWFYGGDHDLVVDTVAMYGGLARKDGARFFFDKGGEVSHFNYFGQPQDHRPVARRAARRRREQAGFLTLVRPVEIDQRVYGRARGAPNGRRVRRARPHGLAISRSLTPGSGSISPRSPGAAWASSRSISPEVQAESPVARAYGGLIEYLSEIA